jgi:hypothetical protein
MVPTWFVSHRDEGSILAESVPTNIVPNHLLYKIETLYFGFCEKKTFFPAKSSFFALKLACTGRKKNFDAKCPIQTVFSVSISMRFDPLLLRNKNFNMV